MIVITGATGQLGKHVVAQLLEKLPAHQIAVAVRQPEKAASFAAQGVEVRAANYSDKTSVARAFQGATKVLLISGNELGKRFEQHQNVIDAAREAGVGLLVYTSLLRADSAHMGLKVEHLQTEEYLLASGIPSVILRNGWYIENYTENLGPALQFGAIAGAAGEGRIGAAARADYAAAAVAVLTQEGHAGKRYELSGDVSFTMSELAAEVARQAGRSVVYQDMPTAQYEAFLTGVGLPPVLAAMLANADEGVRQGDLESQDDTLRQLIGRPTTPLSAGVAAALKA